MFAAFEEREARRDSCLLRVAGAIMVSLAVACGGCWFLLPDLCEEEDVVLVPAPHGRAVARTFLWNCGATTGYVNVAALKVDGWPWERGLYRSDDGGMPQLSWAADSKLVVDCSACAYKPDDFVFHGVSVSYVKSRPEGYR